VVINLVLHILLLPPPLQSAIQSAYCVFWIDAFR